MDGADMASFHVEFKHGYRGEAKSHADYIARAGSHGARRDLVYSGHGNLPEWTGGAPTKLWKASDQYERKNGTAFREAIIALPNELTLEQNIALVNDLVEKVAPERPHQVAIHAPKSSLQGEPNPHAHVMTCERMADGIDRPAEKFFSRYNSKQPEKGGRRKARCGYEKEQRLGEIIDLRRTVADTINDHLRMNGHSARVDHRTLREQGIKREPELHLGQEHIRNMLPEEKAVHVAMRREESEASQ
ncbi:MobA/MobL family protein [Luteimonas mephitis]|uniref:MobA/MobL family protein n=1 Tax=Luteimonas mephitis TaxID=83615 RepID=UPI001B7FA857|nr:MobA/MobL family protein [Luteimonas mephitis]